MKVKRGSRENILWILSRTGWAVLLVLGLFFLIQQVIAVSQGPTDFCNDYLAAQRARLGLLPYVPLNCTAGAAHFPPPIQEYDTHPPFSLLFLLGWSLLPLQPATLLWGLWCLLAYLASGFLLLRELGWRSWKGLACFTLGSVLWLPLVYSEQMLNLGQTLTLLVVGAWVLERRGRQGWSGVLIGLAGLLKLWPAGLLLLSLLRRQWRQAIYGGITLLAGTLVTLWIPGLSAYSAYLGPVQRNERYVVPSDVNDSLVAAIARPFTGIPGALPPLIPGVSLSTAIGLGEGFALLIGLGALGWIAWLGTRREADEGASLLSWGLLVTILLLIFPVNPFWGQVTLILPAATLVLARRQLPKAPRGWLFLLAVGLAEPLGLGWLFPTLLWNLVLSGRLPRAGWETLVLGLPSLLLLLLAGALAWALWQVRREAKALAYPD